MKAAIAGCGIIAAVHARCLAGMKDAELTAFADIRPERAQEFAKEYGGNAYASIDEMLEKEQIDVLHICLPHYLHVPVAIQALNAGVNVFMEKPPAISREQLKQLQDVYKRQALCSAQAYRLSGPEAAPKQRESGSAAQYPPPDTGNTGIRRSAYPSAP